jgi:ATP-dependent DNA helicase RecG
VTEAELRSLLAEQEDETVEFKPNLPNRREIAEYAVGIGNAGGGWLIMGVADRPPHHVQRIEIPSDDELAKIRQSVADAAQIHITIETVHPPEGAVLVARIPPRPRGLPFHTRDGKYLIRLGDGLRGMTLPEIDAIRREAGMELSASPIPGKTPDLLSPAGMEELRRLMAEAGASSDLNRLRDPDLLHALGVLREDGALLTAGLLLAGRPETIRAHLPHAQWQFRRMKADTEYDQAEDGSECLPIALRRLRELVAANNPIATIPGWLVHPEFPRYPALALRELLVNALAHRDYEVPGAVMVKLYPDRTRAEQPRRFRRRRDATEHPPSPVRTTLSYPLSGARPDAAGQCRQSWRSSGVPRLAD